LAEIGEEELKNWRRMIGLRNVLVHDYLNVDPEVITSILENRYYEDIQRFVDKGCVAIERALGGE